MLKVHARNLGNVAILCLQGRIVNGETATLREAVDSQSEARTLVLDLARVTAVDARGLGVMLELRELAHAKGIGFKIINATRLVIRVLEITRLDSVFEVSAAAEYLPAIKKSHRAPSLQFARCA